MRQDLKPYLEPVKGNTYCIVTGYGRIPLYKLDAHNAILLDCGLPRDWEGIRSCLEEAGLWVRAVLISHGHVDHDGNLVSMRKYFGARCYLSMFAATVYAEPENRVNSILGMSTYRQIKYLMPETLRPDVVFDWRQNSVTVEGVPFDILQLPGHCPEHMGFITPDNVAYLGDTILSEKLITSLRLPFCTCLEPDLQSKEQVAELNCDRYILAHSEVRDEIRQLAIKNRDCMLEKAAMVESLAEDYISMEGMVRRILESTPDDGENIRKVQGLQRNAVAFVDYLLDTGRLTRRANNGTIEYIRTK